MGIFKLYNVLYFTLRKTRKKKKIELVVSCKRLSIFAVQLAFMKIMKTDVI